MLERKTISRKSNKAFSPNNLLNTPQNLKPTPHKKLLRDLSGQDDGGWDDVPYGDVGEGDAKIPLPRSSCRMEHLHSNVMQVMIDRCTVKYVFEVEKGKALAYVA